MKPRRARTGSQSPGRGFLVTVSCFLFAFPAFAHVGSPNVFFEGLAGPQHVRVVIRPPAVLPGTAQVDVRVEAEGVTNVLLQATLFEAGKDAAPSPVTATLVAGETNLFNAPLWLFRNGSYSVEVTVESARGRGSVSVPLNSAAIRRPQMSGAVAAGLACLGLALFIAAIWLVAAAARDASLEPGDRPIARDHRRARFVAAAAAALLAGGLYAGKVRWQNMDREFRNNALYKPLPVSTSVRTNGTIRLLHLGPAQENPGEPGWDTLVADHGKLMHLFLIHEPDLDTFAHLHPVRRDSRAFESVLPPLPAGSYTLYAEITHENGLNQTLTTNVILTGGANRPPQAKSNTNMANEVFCRSGFIPAGNSAQPFALDADDSWHGGAVSGRSASPFGLASPLMDGCTMLFKNAGELVENREMSLRFSVFLPDGSPAVLRPYMGMLGHAAVRCAGGEVFTHLHPLGTISMASQELFARRDRGEPIPSEALTNSPVIAAPYNSSAPANEVTFPYAFPRPGDYRLWVQVRTGERVLTGVFDVVVKAANLASR